MGGIKQHVTSGRAASATWVHGIHRAFGGALQASSRKYLMTPQKVGPPIPDALHESWTQLVFCALHVVYCKYCKEMGRRSNVSNEVTGQESQIEKSAHFLCSHDQKGSWHGLIKGC